MLKIILTNNKQKYFKNSCKNFYIFKNEKRLVENSTSLLIIYY